MKKIARPLKQPLKQEERELENNGRTPHSLQSPSMIVIVRLCQFLRPFLWKVRWSCGQFHHGGGTQKLYFMTILTPGRKHPTPLWPSIPSPSQTAASIFYKKNSLPAPSKVFLLPITCPGNNMIFIQSKRFGSEIKFSTRNSDLLVRNLLS